MKRNQVAYDQAVIDRCVEKINAHNLKFEAERNRAYSNVLNRYYIIDTTGEHKVFFTLYNYIEPLSPYVNPYTFIKNLSIDLEKAVDTVIEKSTYKQASVAGLVHTPIVLVNESNNSPLAMKFRARTKEGIPTIPIGKYRGKTLQEVWDMDRNWVFWFKANYKTQNYRDFRGIMRKPQLSGTDITLRTQAEELINIFYEELKEKNLTESTSEYITPLNQRVTLQCTIQSCSNLADSDSKKYIADCNGNRIQFYSKSSLNRMDVVTVTGTPVKHFESLGRKTTYLNRVKVNV